MTKEQLEKINRFTRRELGENEIYSFSVILCDNDIDRDGECFSDDALAQLQMLFVGKTGIFDHNARSANQNARIFDTEIISDPSRKTKTGEIYKFLKASVYMVRTDENRSLIAEIDGGIKKEVSISCTASQRVCSVCGCDRAKSSCAHIKGKTYAGKLCYTILSGITDAYEWSFVAIPAQVNAGVTKKFSDCENVVSAPVSGDAEAAAQELRRDIRRFAFFAGGRPAYEAAAALAEEMNMDQLIRTRKSFEKKAFPGKLGVNVQLIPQQNKTDADGDQFRISKEVCHEYRIG